MLVARVASEHELLALVISDPLVGVGLVKLVMELTDALLASVVLHTVLADQVVKLTVFSRSRSSSSRSLVLKSKIDCLVVNVLSAPGTAGGLLDNWPKLSLGSQGRNVGLSNLHVLTLIALTEVLCLGEIVLGSGCCILLCELIQGASSRDVVLKVVL